MTTNTSVVFSLVPWALTCVINTEPSFHSQTWWECGQSRSSASALFPSVVNMQACSVWGSMWGQWGALRHGAVHRLTDWRGGISVRELSSGQGFLSRGLGARLSSAFLSRVDAEAPRLSSLLLFLVMRLLFLKHKLQGGPGPLGRLVLPRQAQFDIHTARYFNLICKK